MGGFHLFEFVDGSKRLVDLVKNETEARNQKDLVAFCLFYIFYIFAHFS